MGRRNVAQVIRNGQGVEELLGRSIVTSRCQLVLQLRDPKRSTTRAREQLATRLEEMHGTTINALAAVPVILDIGVIRRELPQALRDDSADRSQLATVVERLAKVAAKAGAPDTLALRYKSNYRSKRYEGFVFHGRLDI
jgi:hypothetical protein